MKREVREETNSDIKLINSSVTLYVESEIKTEPIYSFENIQMRTLSDFEIKSFNVKPWIIYKTTFPNNNTLGVFVFKGKLLTDPTPNLEVPALLEISSETIKNLPLTLADIVDNYQGIIIEQNQKIIPRDAIIYPFGSAEIIKKMLIEGKI